MDIFSPSPDLLSPQHPYPTHSNSPSFSAPSLSAPPGPSCASSAMPPPPPPPPPPSPTQQKLKPPHVVIERHKHQVFPGSIGQVATKVGVECVFGDDVLATTGTTEEGLEYILRFVYTCTCILYNAHTCIYMYMYMYSTAQMQGITNARYERVCAFERTRLRVQGNAFARSRKRVCAFKRTRLRVQGNAFARSSERV